MRSDWYLPLCSGRERLKTNGIKLHPTQKPAALLYRVLAASSNPGDVVLDPFFGTGTTGEAAIRLRRHWIGIEKEAEYIHSARERLANIQPDILDDETMLNPNLRQKVRIPFGSLLEYGYLRPGDTLSLRGDVNITASITGQGKLN